MAKAISVVFTITAIENNFYFGTPEGVVVDYHRSNLTDQISTNIVKEYLTKKNMGGLVNVSASDNIPVLSRDLNKQEVIRFDAVAATFVLAQDVAVSVNENNVFMDMMEK